uniref:Apoptosis facilitator Bcl-2-like protein 14 n=1 Tax=Castor canadensis TaxID=51338 RepID=A0A8C1A048_CASCN
MCSSGSCDLEDIPLEDDDPDSIEFKILAYYTRHHVFKSSPEAFSPQRQGAASQPQKGRGTQVSPPFIYSSSSEKNVNLGKKKSSWRTFFGATQKEDDLLSWPGLIRAQGQQGLFQGGSQGEQWFQHLESAAVDPKVASIANRVAEIIHSWSPPEDHHSWGTVKLQGKLIPQAQDPGFWFENLGSSSSKKDGEDEVIARVVELLKQSGDHLESELKKDKALMNSLQDKLSSYSMFETITDQLLRDVDTRGESEAKARGFKAALAIDATAKLTAVDNHPMNRVLGFGTKYLKEHFSSWVQQHGGWEKILGIPHEEVD